jgi:hypothetical protein
MSYHPDQNINDSISNSLTEDELVMLADGFEEAFIGIARQFNQAFAVYDRAKCISILTKDMTLDEADEHFSYNVEGAWVGENTPAFINLAPSLTIS